MATRSKIATGKRSSHSKVIRGTLAKTSEPGESRTRPQKRQPTTHGPYKYAGITYPTKAALIVGYLDGHKVFTGKVRPPSVAEFVRDTGVQAGHGMYGARLHEYCHTARTDKEGTYTIDRRALRAGKDGRVFQKASVQVSRRRKEAA